MSDSIERTRNTLESYWRDHDSKHVAEDAVFIMLPTGEEIRGRKAIDESLKNFYHGALTANAEVVSSLFGENKGIAGGDGRWKTHGGFRRHSSNGS